MLRFQNTIRIFCCLEHVFAANFKLVINRCTFLGCCGTGALMSFQRTSNHFKQCTPRVLYVLFAKHLFWKTCIYSRRNSKNSYFSRKKSSHFATRNGTVKFWKFWHEITLREVPYNKKMHVWHVPPCFSLPNLQVELLWWWYSM